MRKGRFLISFILISVFLLSDLNCIHVQSESYAEGIVGQVKKYTSDFDAEEFNNCLENGEYHEAKELLEEAREGYQERWDYKGLTTNDMYVAYQFKEYMTDNFFSKGWWAKITSWFSGFFYNDELKEYITLQSPGKNKYKDMLKQLINDTKDDLLFWEYAKNINTSFQNIEGINDCIKDAVDKEDINKKILELIDGNETHSFANNLSESFTFLGAGIDYIDTTVSTIMDIQYVCANKEVVDKYIDLFENIQNTKDENGNYIAPKDLRDAAKELKEELEGDYSKIIENAINEYAYTSAVMGIELAELIGDGFLSQISLGLEIGSFIGNAGFDMSGLVQGVSYVQGYAYLGEIYTIILENDKANFLKNKSEENARKFRDDYNILCIIRLKGEKAYLEMNDFSGTWLEADRKLLQKWTDYCDKKDFCDSNMEMIKSFRFKEPVINNANKNLLSRVNYYGFDGSLLYYETYVYYDNGLLCSKTFHLVDYFGGNSEENIKYTFLYLYDEEENLVDTVLDSLHYLDWYDKETKGIILKFEYDENGEYYETVFYPESESIEQEKFGVDPKKTEQIFDNAPIIYIESNNEWSEAYLDSIFAGDAQTDSTKCSILYVNDDIIPEIWIDYGYGYAGAEVYTVKNGVTDKVYISHGNAYFMEKNNLLLTSGGHMDVYNDTIYKIDNGKFVKVEEGNFGATNNAEVQYDEEGYPIYTYYWNQVETTEEEYDQKLNSIFDISKSINANQNVYTYNQCKLLIESIVLIQ